MTCSMVLVLWLGCDKKLYHWLWCWVQLEGSWWSLQVVTATANAGFLGLNLICIWKDFFYFLKFVNNSHIIIQDKNWSLLWVPLPRWKVADVLIFFLYENFLAQLHVIIVNSPYNFLTRFILQLSFSLILKKCLKSPAVTWCNGSFG